MRFEAGYRCREARPEATAHQSHRESERTFRPGPTEGNHHREALRRPQRSHGERDLVERLEAEWPVLAAGPLRAQLRQWAAREPALVGFATPQQLLRHLRGLRGRTKAEDEILAALVRQARADPLARRVVLQALLPGLKTVAKRILVDADQRDEVWAALLFHCWERICCYPLERRPTRIAANVVLDSLNQTTREFRRELRNRDRFGLELPEEHPAAAPVDSDVVRLVARAVASSAITAEEANLILRTRIDGTDLRALADASGIAYHTLKVRRLRAEKRLLLFLGHPGVTFRGSKALLSSARVIGAGLTGSAGRGAATHQPRRR